MTQEEIHIHPDVYLPSLVFHTQTFSSLTPGLGSNLIDKDLWKQIIFNTDHKQWRIKIYKKEMEEGEG